LLEVFFATHDPTTLNRQGADVGTQYRSAVFYRSPEQKQAAEAVIAELSASGGYSAPIVTQVAAFENYFPAEDYHQNYFAEHPTQSYCCAVIPPKLAKLRTKFAEKLRT
jgi:peptide-methionine (S)-S-oxide reductase